MAADLATSNNSSYNHAHYQPKGTFCVCCVCSLHQHSVRGMQIGSEYLCSFLMAHISDQSGHSWHQKASGGELCIITQTYQLETALSSHNGLPGEAFSNPIHK